MRLLALMLLCFAAPTRAEVSPFELRGYVDFRAVDVDSSLTSFMHGGSGLLRFDQDHDDLQFGRLTLDFNGPIITDSLRSQLTMVATDNGGDNVLDLTEAFVEWRPYPRSSWSWRTKVGAFYPPVSLENRGVGWQSLYSLSPSAINTWIGEEVRAVGMEVKATNAGAPVQRPFDVSIVTGVYGWNDPMGILLFRRGWAIHDHEVPLFGQLPRPFPRATDESSVEFSHEIDNRAGYYAGIETKWYGQHVLRVLHYDNRGDPAQANRSDPAWLSRFDAVGARIELPANLTLIAQWLGGDTAVGRSADGRGKLIADYSSYFVLASYSTSRHRFTLRYDSMSVESTRGSQMFDSDQDAHAWTAAYLYSHDEHWLIGIETLRIDGSLQQRERVGLPAATVEQQRQLAVRYSF
jgi:hypothetical protein